MSNNLYEEAINAAEQIKEAAESRVKQQLVEAMSPKIKQLIENSLMEEPDECGESIEEVEECGESIDEDESKEEEMDSEEDQIEISSESVNILKKMLGQKQKRNAISENLDAVRKGINSLKKAMILAENNKNSAKIKRKFVYAYNNLLQELKNIKSSSIIKTDKTLLKEFLQLSKELNNMSRSRSRSRYLNENLEDLLEMNLFEEEEEMDLDAEMDSEDESKEEEMDSEEESEKPGSEGVDLGPLEDMSFREVVDAALSGADSGEEEMDLSSLDDDEDEMEEGVDEVYEVEENLEGLEGVEEMEIEEMEDEGLDEGLFLEIDENMLKREIKNMRRLREGEAKDMASHFGGGSLDKEMFIDGVDLNVHADHLGREDVPTPKVEAALRNAVRKNRIVESKNKQYKNALRGMKKQLTEMNLFNAKLLYANKLMQNRDLSIKQQKHIVESLDEAGTLNEAKLLFESLSKSLSRPSRKGGNLNESSSRRVLSSSSRSVKSAQPINENVALDRWATLAGIKK